MSYSNSDYIILLRIEKGIGLNKSNNSDIIITATLGENQIETNIVPAGQTTNFKCDLIWEADRNSIKQMKQSNLPIRLECFSVNLKLAKKESIGFVTLPMRCIPMQSQIQFMKLSAHWHKLMGLNMEWKNEKPQILLLHTIRNKLEFAKEIEEINETSSNTESESEVDLIVMQNGDEIQVGNSENDIELYLLDILLIEAKHLDNLLTEHDPLTNRNFEIHFQFQQTFYKFMLEKKFNGNYSINKNIHLKFRSSYQTLDYYFNTYFKLKFKIFLNMQQIGRLELTNKHGKFTEEFCKDFEIKSTNHNHRYLNSKSNLELKFTFKKISEPFFENEIDLKSTTSSSRHENKIVSFRDEELVEKSPKSQKAKNTLIDTIISPLHKLESKDEKEHEKVRRTYLLSLLVSSLKFDRKPEIGIWHINFTHDKSDTQFTIANLNFDNLSDDYTITFENLELKLYFSYFSNEILNVIESGTTCLFLNGPQGLSARADLDNSHLLEHSSRDKLGIVLLENAHTNENIARANICMYLEDLGMNFNIQLKNSVTAKYRPYFDEKFAIKIVEELEHWKLIEQENFLIEMKRQENLFLERLSNEWKNKKMEQEQNLSKKLEQCTILTRALEEAQRNVKQKEVQQIQEEKTLNLKRLELENMYQYKLMEINENLRRIEDDENRRLKLDELKYRNIESIKNKLENENTLLKTEINRLNEKITEISKNSCSKEQFNNLYEELIVSKENFEAAQKSKILYKTKWAKLVRRMNQTHEGQQLSVGNTFRSDFTFDDNEDDNHNFSSNKFNSIRS